MRTALLLGTTATLALTLSIAGFTAAGAAHKAKPVSKSALLAKGKAIVTAQRCDSCHGKDLKGKKMFSPSLTASGCIKKYNPKAFERVMNDGTTEDGGHVKDPMPVYKMKAADSDALYAYFKSLK